MAYGNWYFLIHPCNGTMYSVMYNKLGKVVEMGEVLGDGRDAGCRMLCAPLPRCGMCHLRCWGPAAVLHQRKSSANIKLILVIRCIIYYYPTASSGPLNLNVSS